MPMHYLSLFPLRLWGLGGRRLLLGALLRRRILEDRRLKDLLLRGLRSDLRLLRVDLPSLRAVLLVAHHLLQLRLLADLLVRRGVGLRLGERLRRLLRAVLLLHGLDHRLAAHLLLPLPEQVVQQLHDAE